MKYEGLEFEITFFTTEDVITTSKTDETGQGTGGTQLDP